MNVDRGLQAIKDLAHDVWEDLSRTRLAGVAVGLALALLAITAVVLRPHAAPDANAGQKPAPAAVPAGEVSFTVPGDEPMRMSDVDLSTPRDPFESLDGLAESAANEQTLLAADETIQDAVTATAPSGGSGSSVGTPVYDNTSSLLPLDDLADPAPVTDYSYAVDVQFGLVDDLERYAGVQRLGLVPSRRLPLLMYLGVSSDRKTAVFMVDSRLSQGGEGECVPKNSLCTFLELKATADHDEHHFRDADGNEYLLRLLRVVRTTASAGTMHGRSVSQLDGSPSMIDGSR